MISVYVSHAVVTVLRHFSAFGQQMFVGRHTSKPTVDADYSGVSVLPLSPFFVD